MIRRIKIGGLDNLRDIGGYQAGDGEVNWGRFYRSDLPVNLSEEDKRRFVELGITTVIDLRTELERKRQTDELEGVDGIDYRHCPAFGDGRLPGEGEGIVDTYMEIALGREHMYQIIKAIIDAPQAVLFHCTAGKDRTGVTAALLMLLAGVYREDIVADYTLTGTYMAQKLKRLISVYPELPIHWLIPKGEYMEEFLDKFHEVHPSIEEYFVWLGFGKEEIARLKEKLVG